VFEALEREKHRKAEGLKELPGDTSRVVLRFAPNPNGPLTLGHSRGVVINSEYARMYDGKVVLRFDDTDTKVKPPLPEAYGWIEDEYEWLAGRSADIIIRASERMPLYLEHAERMIAERFGYVCRCSADEFRGFREEKQDCPCRGRSAAESLSDWKSMPTASPSCIWPAFMDFQSDRLSVASLPLQGQSCLSSRRFLNDTELQRHT
jgi:glutamyl-tRNA synthetase